MARPKLLIIVLFQNLGEKHAYYAIPPAPPLSGALLAGLTPPVLDIELLHEQIRPIDYDTDADFIALSFMDFCAPHAYEVARRFRARGKIVIAGGRYPTTFPAEVMPHVDSVVVGEAERIWPRVVADLVSGRLSRMYRAPIAPPLDGIPPPRYDLVESAFDVPIVTEATRGCPFRCSYCQLSIEPAPHRCRPIDDVLRDLTATAKLPFRKQKMAMLYDNNLGGNLAYAKELLTEIAGLGLWGLGVQFSFNCLKDDVFLDRLAAANCRMAFVGMESLDESSLAAVNKTHNKVQEYEQAFARLRERGILVFAGTMLALEGDTPAYYERLPRDLERVDPSAIFLSISIPIPGTPFHRQMQEDDRLVDDDLSHYDGDHLVFEPRQVSTLEVYRTFEELGKRFYSWMRIWRRWSRLMRAYLTGGNPLRRFLPALLLSFILLKLSIFQRGHLRQRVIPLMANAPEEDLDRAEDARLATGGG